MDPTDSSRPRARSERPPVGELRSWLLGLFSAPRVNMREDYAKVRRLQRALAGLPSLRYQPIDVTARYGEGTHPVPIRMFLPRERSREEVVLFLHGGGWVTGDVESYTPACAAIADTLGCPVASVDYRLAPEHPFPAGLEDCYRVARMFLAEPWRVGLEDARSLVLMGDSAGGNLAAVVSQRLAREGHAVPRRQILLYPVTQEDHDPVTSPFESVRRYGEGLRLTSAEVRDYLELYVPDPERRRDPEVAPLHGADLTGQPDTLVITAQLDLLADEGAAYAAALEAAGNRVLLHEVAGALHGFITLPRRARAPREALGVMTAFLDDGPPG